MLDSPNSTLKTTIDGNATPPSPYPTAAPSNSASASTSKAARSTADYSLSCAECRRLKLKCSRVRWPCETCIKRGIPHLCPDGVQKQKGKNQGSLPSTSKLQASSSGDYLAGTDRVSNGNGPPTMGVGGDNSMIWARLDGLERKLDMLVAASTRNSTTSTIPFTNHSLHDLASIATDHYAMQNGHESTSQRTEETTRPQHGTLTLHPDGRAHYMGSNAHSMYLARENLSDEASEGRRVSFRDEFASRPGSPTPVDLEAVTAGHHARETIIDASPRSPLEGNTPSTIESQPAQLVWATPGFRSPHSSTAIWGYLKSALPTREMAQRMMDVYYATVTFMFHPIPRKDFESTVWDIFYSHSTIASLAPPPNFHPHKLALLYSMLSLGVLLDVQRPQRDPAGRALYSCAWSALALSNFTEATSLEAILALMHINMYLTWRRGGRYAESAYPLLGTMMRMAISTGLHRDPALFNMVEEQREKRRRVFWDIQSSEVFRAFAFCRPPALCDRHVDTKLPTEWQLEAEEGIMPTLSSQREGNFHAFKCKLVQITNRMLDECLCATSSYQTTLRFDEMLRQQLLYMPAWMLPTLLSLEAKARNPIQDLERSYNEIPFRDDMILEMQRHTTLLNHYQALLLLHRGWFSQALQSLEGEEDGQNTPGRAATPINFQHYSGMKLSTSISAVNESASKIIAITISAYCKFPSLVIRWAFFWNAIFSAAVCRGLLVVKSLLIEENNTESQKAWKELKKAIELLEDAVIGWSPLESPLGILKRLNKRAEVVMLGGSNVGVVEKKVDEVEREKKRKKSKKSDEGQDVQVEGEDLELIGEDGGKRGKRKSMNTKDSNQKKLKRELAASISDNGSLQRSAGNIDVSLLDSGPTFDLTEPQITDFMGVDQSSLYSTMLLPSVFSSDVSTDFSNLNAATSSGTASASQLIQMLSSGLGWDDVSSWNDLIVDL